MSLTRTLLFLTLLAMPCVGWLWWDGQQSKAQSELGALDPGQNTEEMPPVGLQPGDLRAFTASPRLNGSGPLPAGAPLSPATSWPTKQRQVVRETPELWEHRYREITLATVAEAIRKAEARLIETKDAAAQACFADPEKTIDMHGFVERDRLDNTLYLPRHDPKSGETLFALIREADHPRVFDQRRELRWLLERRLGLQRQPRPRPSRSQLAPPRPPNEPDMILSGSEEWILCGKPSSPP